MKYKTRRFIVRAVALITVLALLLFFASMFSGCNRAFIDTAFKFERAIIYLPDGKTIEGKVESWLDYESSDMIQVKIDGEWYMTHSSNVLLITGDK